MNDTGRTKTTRRQFVRGAGRAAVLTALAAGTAATATRKHDERCAGSGRCHGCALLAGCDLPPAKRTRQACLPGQTALAGWAGR